MKISDLLKLSTDNLRRRKGRTALTVIGVVVGTCAIVVMISLGIATNVRTDQMLSEWSDLTQITVYGGYSELPDTPDLDDKMVKKFQEMSNIVAATPMYNFERMDAEIKAGKGNRYSMYMWNAIGMDITAIEPMGIELISGSYLSGDSYGRNKIPVLVGEETAYQFEDTKKSWRNPDRQRWKEVDENGNITKLPFFDITKEKLTMKMNYAYDDNGVAKTRDYELIVVGVVKTDHSKQGTTGIIMDINEMKRLEEEYNKLTKSSGSGGGSYSYMMGGSGGNVIEGYSTVYVKVDDVNNVGAAEKIIKDLGYNTNSTTQIREDMQKQVASSQMMLGGLAAVSLLVAALNIANTMTMAIYERTKEIGVMKVLGCKLSKIRGMFLIESGTIGFLGGIVGCVLSLGISYVLNNFSTWLQHITTFLASIGIVLKSAAESEMGGSMMGGLMGGMSGMGGTGPMSIVPFWLYLAALIFATIVGLLSGIAPANRAVKISALEAIRHE